jgi:hypothetical protein
MSGMRDGSAGQADGDGMRHSLRIAWNGLALLSALLCAAAVWFWLTGYIQGWYGHWERESADGMARTSCELYISGGGLSL